MSDPKHEAITVVERPGVPERVHPLVAAAMKAGTLDPGSLRELVEVQKLWEANEAKKEFDVALVALKAALPPVLERDAKVDYQGAKGRVFYMHTSLAAAMDAITGPLGAHGFSLAWTTDITDKGMVEVVCELAHIGGHRKTSKLCAPPDGSGGKNPAQAVASTSTLLQRYTALSLLGIATRDMKDPEPAEPDPERIDTARNLRAVGKLAKMGKKREDAEAFLGKPVAEWTAADLDKIKDWVKPTGETT